MKDIEKILDRGKAAIVVQVVEIRGSAPREAGAAMLVTADNAAGTIGGGELEYRAIRHARSLLDSGSADWVDWSLGPELAQCCGGAVTLTFEPFVPADRAFVGRASALSTGREPTVWVGEIGSDGSLARRLEPGPLAGGLQLEVAVGERLTIRQPLSIDGVPLWIFGAGHVGRAVVNAVAPLFFDVTWIDSRMGQFPPDADVAIRCMELAMPELIVDETPPGTLGLVMTHSHAQDEEICAAFLAHGEFAYLGLIGSKTKFARFRKRLLRRGFSEADIARIVCPIGVPGVTGKDPPVIAASVAADLLIRCQGGTAAVLPPAHYERATNQ